jgi:hypothetical protein
VIADVATDVANDEQLSICVPYVDGGFGKISVNLV